MTRPNRSCKSTYHRKLPLNAEGRKQVSKRWKRYGGNTFVSMVAHHIFTQNTCRRSATIAEVPWVAVAMRTNWLPVRFCNTVCLDEDARPKTEEAFAQIVQEIQNDKSCVSDLLLLARYV